MTCCHKCKICTQTVCRGPNVKFNFIFRRKPVSSLTDLLQCYGHLSQQNLFNARKLDTAAYNTVIYLISLIHNLNHKTTPTGSRTDCNKLCSSQSIIYVTVKNRQRIYLLYLLENSMRLIYGKNGAKT